MIPEIRARIDLANSDQDQDHGDGERERVVIPQSELIELGEWRRREHSQRTREKRDLELAKMEEAKAIADSLKGQPRDTQRPFGLPDGEALEDVWEPILDYICDLDDIVQVRDTCKLFRSLLQQKYITLRLNQVLTKFPNELGDLNTLLSFRLVCLSNKAAVDKLFLSDALEHPSFPYENMQQLRDQRIPKPWPLSVSVARFYLDKLRPIVSHLELSLQSTFPLRMMTISYHENFQFSNNPDILVLRTQFGRLLELVGDSIKSFEFRTTEENLETYNRLRAWVTFMPNLVELGVRVDGRFNDDPNPPVALALQLQPFPTCPMLKRFTIDLLSGIMSSTITAEIIRANPTITEVIHYYLAYGLEVDQWKEEEFIASLRSLENFQLTRFDVISPLMIPPLRFFDLRFAWPLKQISLTNEEVIDGNPAFPSRSFVAFANSFTNTLEDLNVQWRMQDTGGFLVLPKLTKLRWKIWPEFVHWQFSVGIENLEYFEVDLTLCPEPNNSFVEAKRVMEQYNIPSVFPALKELRVKIGFTGMRGSGDWRIVWKS